MRKQHTIINANDIHAALAGQEVAPMKKTRKTASKAAQYRSIGNTLQTSKKTCWTAYSG